MVQNNHSLENIPQHWIFFDGVCNLCNGSVLWVIRQDRQNRFFFSSLQQTTFLPVQQLKGSVDTILYYRRGKLYRRSTAALLVLWDLGRYWRLLAAFGFLFPAFIRNGVYNWIARHRYQWFGKKETCMVPTPELQSRFPD